MYQEIFNFSGRPFTMAPFVKHFFHESPVKQSLDKINESISRDAGPAIVIGEHGTGKSLLLALLSEHYQQRFRVISLSCAPMVERRDLLQAILFELKQPYHNLSEGELRLSLIDFIKPAENCPNGILLLIDDAQALTPDLVDELRMITNFVRDGVPRVRLVLCGTSRFEDVLTDPKLEAFNQRLSTRCFLGNLTREQTRGYIQEHISRVGGDAGTMFEQQTADAIHEATCGCPRFVNQLSEQCMIYAATRGSMVVEPDMVEPAWAQVQGLPTSDPAEVSAPKSNDENWTVIEFGTLEEDETGSFSEPVELTRAIVEAPEAIAEAPEAVADAIASTDADIFGESMEPKSDSDLTEPTESETSWSDVGSDDPFVAPEQAEQSTNNLSESTAEPSDSQEDDGYSDQPLDDKYSYQPLDTELDSEPDTSREDEEEANSIPTEFVELNRDQEAVWEAARSSIDGLSDAPTDESEQLPSSEPSDSPVEETGGISSVQSTADFAFPAIPVAAAAAAASIASPFAEAFETEESVANDFTEQVTAQNMSSTEVTGEQLDHLSPTVDEPESADAIPVVSVVNENVQEYEAEVGETAESAGMAADQEPSVAESDDTGSEIDNTNQVEYTAAELASVFDSHVTDTTPSLTAESDDTSLADEVPEATAFHAASSSLDQTYDSPAEAAPETKGFHEHEVHESTADIQQQATEILNAIRNPGADQAVDNVVPEPLPQGVDGSESMPSENAEISDAQQILSEILENKKLIGGQMASSGNAINVDSADSEYPQSLPMQQTYPSADASSEAGAGPGIKPSLPQSVPDSLTPPSGLTPDGSQASIGRAERMDYERLFEQLRDSGNQS